jgi:hypothetical protein
MKRFFKQNQFELPKISALVPFEWLGILLVAVCLLIFCTLLEHRAWMLGRGDTAFLVDLVDEIALKGDTQSQMVSGIFAGLDILAKPAGEVCQAPLLAVTEPVDVFRRAHPYFVLYLIAPLAKFVSADWLLSAVMALNSVGLLVFAYFILRLWAAPVGLAVLFAMLVASHPIWGDSFRGQFYVDRIFAVTGSLLCIALTIWRGEIQTFRRLIIFSALFLLALSVNDRVGVICALALGTFALVHRMSVKSRVRLLVFAVLALTFSVYLLASYVQKFAYNENFNTIGKFLSYFSYTVFEYSRSFTQLKALTFVGINLLLFGHWMRKTWMIAPLAFLTMLPNLLYSVGGAEKAEWSTHYHSLYFPFLIWAVGFGLATTWRNCSSRKGQTAIVVFLIANILALTFVSRDWSISIKPLAPAQTWIARMAQGCRDYADVETETNAIRNSIPAGSSVTSVEPFMTLWRSMGQVDYWPLGVGSAEYVVLARNEKTGEFQGYSSLRGPDETVLLRKCLHERMSREGFDVERPLIRGRAAIFKRNSRKIGL